MKQEKKKGGFTLIEILLIIALIGILVTVLLVSLNGAKIKAQDVATFTSFKSVAPAAFICLTSGVTGVALRNPEAGDICNNPPAVENAKWPDFSKYGWSNTLNGNPTGFFWCDINSSGGTRPATGSAYANGTFGGVAGSGDFCIMLKRDNDKYIWCTEEGCKKEGF